MRNDVMVGLEVEQVGVEILALFGGIVDEWLLVND